jgi:hypothetical protein
MGELRHVVAELLDQRWSPQQISRHFAVRFAEQPQMWLCHEASIRLYRPDRGCCGHRGWRRSIADRCAPGEITGVLISAQNSVGRGFSSRC